MTKREIIYDIITILQKGGYTDDSMLDEDYIGYKVDEKRAKEIRDSYNKNLLIDAIVIQDFGITDVSETNMADDKDFDGFACPIGKVTLPPVVSIENRIATMSGLGINSIRSVNAREEFHFKHFGPLMEIDKLSDQNSLKKYKYYTRLHNSIYLMPYVEKIRPLLILERPLDGYVILTENIASGNLIAGETYTVISGQVIHNSLAYNTGQNFTAINANYTGIGKIQFKNQKRRMTDLDEYPMPSTMAEIVIIKILTQEFKIEAKQIADIRNNSQDSLRVLQASNE